MTHKRAFTLAGTIFTLTLVLDQVSKVIVEKTFHLYESLPLIPCFNLTYVRNEGAAWGIFSGKQYLLILIALLALSLCTLFWKRIVGKSPCYIPLGGLLYAGIIGNLIDRIRLNYVIDFFDVYFGTWHYPCFNIADIAICLAVIGIIAVGAIAPSAQD